MYDVTTRHILKPIEDYIEAAVKNVLSIHKGKNSLGDVLVFMPGECGHRNVVKSNVLNCVQDPMTLRGVVINYGDCLRSCLRMR